jgi:LysM repeat protein
MITLIFLVITLFAFLPGEVMAGNLDEATYDQYTVNAGDTLWHIARRISPDHVDVRDTVHLIKRANHLDSSLIQPGQELIVPTY